MKLTLEQKAFFEYGGAWEQVVLTHKGIRSTVKALPGKTRQKLLRQARNETHQHELVLNAWQKRAVCRAWVPLEKRECRTCSYLEEDGDSEICENCMIFNSLASSYNWEPRKEEQDND